MMDTEFNLVNFIEKPTPEQVSENLDENGKIRVSMNIFKFNGNQSFDFIKNCPINLLEMKKICCHQLYINMISEDGIDNMIWSSYC